MAGDANEIVVLGSGGVWAKGADLDAAYRKGKELGGFGKSVIVAVLPVAAQAWVDEVGQLRWQGQDFLAKYARRPLPGGNDSTVVWPNRRTANLRAAVEAVLEETA